MKSLLGFALLCVLTGAASAQSLFNGTWRPDPQRADPGEKPDSYTLSGGIYACSSCTPSYQVKADGTLQAVKGNPHYDTLSIKIVDDHTIIRTAKKAGKTVGETRAVVSADGATLMETQTVSGMAVRPFEFASKLTRLSAAPAGAHLISGQWRLLESDLPNHEEDTTYRVSGDTLNMSDGFGRSFSAKLDGTEAPYLGDPQYASVSLKLINPRTLEESDMRGGKVVQINRWFIEPDGKTLHAEFDDTHGFVQHQTGHKLNPP